jgi:hypothetical protein
MNKSAGIIIILNKSKVLYVVLAILFFRQPIHSKGGIEKERRK